MTPNEIIRTNMGIYVLRDDTHISRWIENGKILGLGCHEIAGFAKYIPEGGVVIDAGACLGDHTAPYAHLVGPTGHVYAFEPHPLMFDALVKNTAIFHNVTCMPFGLSGYAKGAKMELNANIGASHISTTSDDGEDVRLVALDEMVFERIDFIHLDAEGHEPHILKGARETLKKHRPVMVLECCWNHLARFGESEATLRTLLEDAGYSVHELSAQPYLPERNILCLPL